MSSRERVLQALAFQPTDYIPCCFSAFSALRQRCASQREFVERQLAMGLDVVVDFGELPVTHHPSVRNRQWREDVPGSPYPVLHTQYTTPAGILGRTVHTTADWEHGNEVPFLSDFNIARSAKQLVSAGDSLEALAFLLAMPTAAEKKAYAERAAASHRLAADKGLVTMAGVSQHGDFACWLSGIQDLAFMGYDHPDFLSHYLALIERWNRERLAVVLSQKPDIVVRRGWYENADFWSPDTYRRFPPSRAVSGTSSRSTRRGRG